MRPKLFIPGIKGSQLIDSDGSLRWVGCRQILGLGSSIGLPLIWEGERQQQDGLRPGCLIDRVSLVPGLIGKPVYGPWLRYARRQWGSAWHEFAYDWRRDNNETLRQFIDVVGKLARSTGDRVDVVAHSMGGLITLAHLLTVGAEHVARVVFVGVPFGGSIDYLRDLHEGVGTGLDRSLLFPRSQFSFPSVYTLFPLGSTTVFRDQMGAAVPVDLFSADDWLRLGLGIFAKSSARNEANQAFLERALARAKEFRLLLQLWHELERDVKMLVVTGHGRPTLAQVVRHGPRAVRGWDFRSAPSEDGDGRVLVSNSTPPPPIRFEQYLTTAKHGDILSNPEVQKIMAAFLS